MTTWNGSNKAPKNRFRVIGSDTFPWPHEDYWIGDVADLSQAKELAKAEARSMNSILVFDEAGKVVFVASSKVEKEG